MEFTGLDLKHTKTGCCSSTIAILDSSDSTAKLIEGSEEISVNKGRTKLFARIRTKLFTKGRTEWFTSHALSLCMSTFISLPISRYWLSRVLGNSLWTFLTIPKIVTYKIVL